jgi:ABC-2 type transport system permease protein
MSTSVTYLRYELLRTVRNTRFFIFSLVFPLILFYVVAGANKTLTLGTIPFQPYYMAGMISWGTMAPYCPDALVLPRNEVSAGTGSFG